MDYKQVLVKKEKALCDLSNRKAPQEFNNRNYFRQ